MLTVTVQKNRNQWSKKVTDGLSLLLFLPSILSVTFWCFLIPSKLERALDPSFAPRIGAIAVSITFCNAEKPKRPVHRIETYTLPGLSQTGEGSWFQFKRSLELKVVETLTKEFDVLQSPAPTSKACELHPMETAVFANHPRIKKVRF